MSGYVIVVRPSQPGYTAETYPVDAEGLLSVIALLEDESGTMRVRGTAHSLNVRRTPAGEVIDSVPQGTLLTIRLPTEWADLGGHTYEWGHTTLRQAQGTILLNGWVALGEGLTEGINSNKGEE